MELNDRIFDLLSQQGKKQSDLARALDVRVATISEWKRHRCAPSVTLIAKIADFLGVSIDYLCTGKEYTPTASVVNQGIFGDKNAYNTVTIHGNGTVEISEVEGELIKICGGLDMRHKNALLKYAYELEKQMHDNK